MEKEKQTWGGGGLETDASATSFGGTRTNLLEFSSLCTGSSYPDAS